VAKPVEEVSVKPKVTAKPKSEVKKPTKKPVATKRPSTSGSYYVQVGSFKEKPSKRILSVITGSGFKYTILPPDRIGNKKLLIGPYKTRKEVDKAREVVRDRIHKNAFVIQK